MIKKTALFLVLLLVGCNTTTVPWTKTDSVTKQRTTTQAPQSLVKVDMKRELVQACVDNLDEINASAGVSLLVGKAPGGYEWYTPNPNVRPYGPQDCRGLMITGIDVWNGAVREVRGILGDVANALPWIAVYKLGKAGFKAAGDHYEAGRDIERYDESPRDITDSDINNRSNVDSSLRQEGEGNTQTGPTDNRTETVLPPEEPEEPIEEPEEEPEPIEPDPEV